METGIAVVDDHLDGGLPSGTVAAVVAPPETQSELLLYRLAAERPTLYLSTRRSEESVQDPFHRADVDIADSMIAYADPDAEMDDVGSTISRVGTEHNLIVDPANPLERWDTADYQQFLIDSTPTSAAPEASRSCTATRPVSPRAGRSPSASPRSSSNSNRPCGATPSNPRSSSRSSAAAAR